MGSSCFLLVALAMFFATGLAAKLTCTVNGREVSSGYRFTENLAGNCISKKCWRGDIEILARGCFSNNECHHVGSHWSESCTTAYCTGVVHANHTEYSVMRVNEGCALNDVCYPVGSQWNESCTTANCTGVFHGRRIEYRIMRVHHGCVLNDVCYPVGSQWNPNCTTVNCTEVVHGNSIEYRIMNVNNTEGCFSDNECHPVDDIWYKSCTVAFCFPNDDLDGLIHIIHDGCVLNDVCYPVGSQWNESCSTFNCTKVNYGNGLEYRIMNVTRRCQKLSTCYDVGAEIMIIPRCQVDVCTAHPHGVGFDFKEVLCPNHNGSCYPIDTPYDFVLDGTTHRNCTCQFWDRVLSGIYCNGERLNVYF